MVGRSLFCLVGLALALGSGTAAAAPKAKPKAAPAAKAKKGAEADKEKAAEQEPDKDQLGESDAPDAKTTKEEALKSAGTATPKATDAASVQTKEDKEGVKTYKFDTVEVEGRLKSPQVIYFLRRVRAEFEAGALGHRSFLGELSDSRRSAAFR
jgi:hypothetical protein